MPRHEVFLDIGASAHFPRAAKQHADRLLKPEYPRVRVTETDIDTPILETFDKIRVQDEKVCQGFYLVLASQTRDAQAESLAQCAEFRRQKTLRVHRQNRLLNMRLAAGAVVPGLWLLLAHGDRAARDLAREFRRPLLGLRSYATRDECRNNAPVALISHGEGWHNNNHRYSQVAANHGHRWWEADLTFACVVLPAILSRRVDWLSRGRIRLVHHIRIYDASRHELRACFRTTGPAEVA